MTYPQNPQKFSVKIPEITIENYVKYAVRTESRDRSDVEARAGLGPIVRLTHAAMGMCTEAGEFMDVLKKYTHYNKTMDAVNMEEELGDMMWYIALACDVLNIPLQRVLQKNIEKLAKRYGDRFTELAAKNRNLVSEREVLEQTQKAHRDGVLDEAQDGTLTCPNGCKDPLPK